MKKLTSRSPIAVTTTVAALAGNLFALSLFLASCQDSTSEVSVISDSDESHSIASDSAMSSGILQFPPEDLFALAQSQPNWRLTSWTQDGQAIALMPEVNISLNFEQTQISGTGGCNQYMTNYRVEGDRIIVDPLQATRRACDQPIMEQETMFFAALKGVHQVTLENNEQLTLTYGEEATTGSLIFSP
ncbi:hypothetical protein N836_07055 [Leptolyngbya sp. Heron Island J]|uniref:META domain-containing protein n=1 Tax=Leptolyngbya sp. Heron Island J TaxID=1385935 RepID=UPI0003B94066|nr:META domain-containing protein [Leptolyngbya sp. Heron Island J]ESA36525.1 hypothetical protein N836_07055 [Leptolyngbya sp. Heron Island J]